MVDAKTFNFSSEQEALDALSLAGFSIGRLQRTDPRGLMYGDHHHIMKWRNLSAQDKRNLHGTYKRSWIGGPVTVVLSDRCPEEGQTHLMLAVEVDRAMAEQA